MALIKCPECGQEISDLARTCPHCGAPNAAAPKAEVPRDVVDGAFDKGPSGKSRGVCAVLAILLGDLGVHYFYLGKPLPGIVFLLCCWSCIPAIIALVQGVLMLCSMTQEEFEAKYLDPNHSFPLF